MISDDERREVAERLREFSKDRWSLTVGGNSATIRYAISDIVFGDKKYHSGVDLMNRLADLIEPESERTCRAVRVSGLDAKRGDNRAWPVCSECGRAVRANDRYCPNCGARGWWANEGRAHRR